MIALVTMCWGTVVMAFPQPGEHSTPVIGCETSNLSVSQSKALAVANQSAEKLIAGLRNEDASELTKDWYYFGAIGFDRMVDPMIQDRKASLKSSLKKLGCKSEREMEWFMARLIHLRLAKKAESLKEMLALIREQIHNIDDAWQKGMKKEEPNK
jgi:hypothetical protein